MKLMLFIHKFCICKENNNIDEPNDIFAKAKTFLIQEKIILYYLFVMLQEERERENGLR